MKRISTSDKQLALDIGKAIAEQRKVANLTQEEVAEKLGIGAGAVSRMERGTIMPTVARLMELARIFSCPVSKILEKGSNHPSDQAVMLENLLSTLDIKDRTMLVQTMEVFCKRLANNNEP